MIRNHTHSEVLSELILLPMIIVKRLLRDLLNSELQQQLLLHLQAIRFLPTSLRLTAVQCSLLTSTRAQCSRQHNTVLVSNLPILLTFMLQLNQLLQPLPITTTLAILLIQRRNNKRNQQSKLCLKSMMQSLKVIMKTELHQEAPFQQNTATTTNINRPLAMCLPIETVVSLHTRPTISHLHSPNIRNESIEMVAYSQLY